MRAKEGWVVAQGPYPRHQMSPSVIWLNWKAVRVIFLFDCCCGWRVLWMWKLSSWLQNRVLNLGKIISFNRIALIGLRGAGKSTLGRLVADKLGVPFVELNTLR